MENTISFIEIHVANMDKSKTFFTELFGWKYQDYGPNYADILGAGIHGGLAVIPESERLYGKSPLVVFYKLDLAAAYNKVQELGGKVTKDIFSFPGGQRFEFLDVNGNSFAIWSDQ